MKKMWRKGCQIAEEVDLKHKEPHLCFVAYTHLIYSKSRWNWTIGYNEYSVNTFYMLTFIHTRIAHKRNKDRIYLHTYIICLFICLSPWINTPFEHFSFSARQCHSNTCTYYFKRASNHSSNFYSFLLSLSVYGITVCECLTHKRPQLCATLHSHMHFNFYFYFSTTI